MNRNNLIMCVFIALCVVLSLSSCGSGYQNSWLHPEDVKTVYVEMFDTQSFRRGYEYQLTDAVCKRLEAQTPYKIVSDRNVADTILTGQMTIVSGVLSTNVYTGRALENEATIGVIVTWKNLRTGELIVDKQQVYASGSFSSQLGQTFDSAAAQAVNKAAVRVVELMEKPW